MDTLRFNSRDFPAHLQSEAIECFWGENLLMDVDLRASEVPTFSINACVLPGLSISSFTGSASRIMRSSSQALAANNDLVICIARDSHVKVKRCSRPERVFAPGEAHVWLGDMATSCEVDNLYHATMICIPATVLVNASLDLDRALDDGIAPHTAELKLLADYAENLLSYSQQLSAQAALAAAGHIREMALVALHSFCREKDEAITGKSQRMMRVERIKADIRAHLCHPELSPSWLASRAGISDRYLRYLLAEEQTHFSQLVLDMRLTRSYEQLTDTRYRNHTISAIAFSCGFSDLSYFCRVFKRHFAATPSEIRLGSLNANTQG